MQSIYDNNVKRRSRCANLPVRVGIVHLLTPLILLLSAMFSYEFSLSPGCGLSSVDSSQHLPHHAPTAKSRRCFGARAGRLLLCFAQWTDSFFLVGSPETVYSCLRVGLDVSLYDYKDQLTAEKQVSCWFSLSVPKWPFIQNINCLVHCFPDKYLF